MLIEQLDRSAILAKTKYGRSILRPWQVSSNTIAHLFRLRSGRNHASCLEITALLKKTSYQIVNGSYEGCLCSKNRPSACLRDFHLSPQKTRFKIACQFPISSYSGVSRKQRSISCLGFCRRIPALRISCRGRSKTAAGV